MSHLHPGEESVTKHVSQLAKSPMGRVDAFSPSSRPGSRPGTRPGSKQTGTRGAA